MAADYAGAIAAIKQRFVDAWQSGGMPITPYGFVNERAPATVDGNGQPIAWVLFEIISTGSFIAGSGMPGNHVIIYDGMIKGHVFTPTGTGMGEADGGGMQKAIAIGEIFRNALFYNGVTPGCYVRSGYDLNGPPRIEEGDVTSDDGEWFATTCVCPFEYWHRG
jgi:hypothetical protein